ncbi:MAG: phosphoribosylanthranilate isomerase [Verrucomicrobiota bacterium]
MFRIKICGVTTAADARHAVDCGADAVGVNFYRPSPRFVSEAAAREIVAAVGCRAAVVGVFVNEPPDAIARICGRVGIEKVQLHGQEPAEEAARIGLWRMKVVHAAIPADADALRAYPCEAFLVDSGGPGEYGGTGKTLPWASLAARFPGVLSSAEGGGSGQGKPWLLAGGLTPENVERAISAARPFGVDVSSGVESAPGRKDPAKVAAFIENARAGFRNAGR